MRRPGPKHVVHVVHRLDVGGLENGVVNLVNRMPPDRFRNSIICIAGYGEAFRGRIGRADVEVVSLDKKPGKDLPMYVRMWRELRRLEPDVVHSRNLGTVDMQWVAAAARVRARVHGEHGWEATDPKGLDPRRLRIRRACRPVIHRYVPMSQDIARWLESEVRVPRERIRQLYNGVDTDRFRPDGPRPADLPWRTAATGGLVVGTVGRLDPIKNQAALLRAVRALIDRNERLTDGLRVVVAGDGPLRDSLVRLSAELGLGDRVWFAGARADTPDVMRAMDVFVLPSINEGISNTILEAMATALPVVAGRVGGNPEIVEDGSTGRLYDASNPAGLGQVLLGYLQDPELRRCHGEAGRERTVARFSLDAMVGDYMMLYDELLTGTRH
jgi:sugar transferase (PEP-CTERM/EpsH1 system associated)